MKKEKKKKKKEVKQEEPTSMYAVKAQCQLSYSEVEKPHLSQLVSQVYKRIQKRSKILVSSTFKSSVTK